MKAEVLERLLSRMKEVEFNPRSLSIAAGLNQTFVRDLVRRPQASPSAENLEKLAVALGVDPRWLLYGSADGDDSTASSEHVPETNVSRSVSTFVEAAYGGVVEAGAYRPVAEFEDDPDREELTYPRDPQFPQAKLFVFDVAGDSMNALQPRPILPGDRLLCVSIEQVRISLRDRMVVIIEQVINGGLLRERSVKQIEEYEDRFAFCPRSRSPRHTPIVVPKDFKVDDGRTVAVIAIVRSIVNQVPLG